MPMPSVRIDYAATEVYKMIADEKDFAKADRLYNTATSARFVEGVEDEVEAKKDTQEGLIILLAGLVGFLGVLVITLLIKR